MYLLGVVSIVCALAVAGMVVYLTSKKGKDDDKKEEENFEPPSSVLGNYSKWAAVTDAAPCVNASRWMYGLGGNAFDAAVATLLCHTLASPSTNGIGGGFMATVYLAYVKAFLYWFAVANVLMGV
ncbi:hypothetical protein HPB48_016833 [Haemaphysalis longicornis]|uniref:Uncharacterized protein n=1 Tax=Haemaphysalis longicornis TaxID=44386 RepID=A0A9J6GNR8_HAELO|nr:hypothetical protein HPB48_016833 [Haemaphysalis longicornis]